MNSKAIISDDSYQIRAQIYKNSQTYYLNLALRLPGGLHLGLKMLQKNDFICYLMSYHFLSD